MSDSDGDDDAFQDANEHFSKTPGGAMDLGTSIEQAKVALDLFMNNQFDEARAFVKPWARESMHHAMVHGLFQYLQAIMTFEQEHIQSACQALEQSVETCNKFRKKNSVYASLGKIVRRPNYNNFSEEEIHAELCYAECLLIRAILTFIEDENFMSFVKGGLKIRTCLNTYKECWQILKHRNWGDSKYKIHFESGVRMGVGAFNLMLSMLPGRVMKLLEIVGFSGSRDTGMEQLVIGNSLHGSLRQVLCATMLLGFNLFPSFVLGHGDGNIDQCEKILKQELANFPEGAWFFFFRGRLEYVKGHVDESIAWYKKAWKSQSEWEQFHHLCFWELMWANGFKRDWSTARDFADLLFTKSKFSRTIYGYHKAAIMCMMYDDLDDDERRECTQLFKDIPTWKKRVGGRSLPMEKFAIKKCERFFAQGNRLTLPAVELMYMLNGFKIVGKHQDLVHPFLLLIEQHIRSLEAEKTKDKFYVDNKCLLLLLKGVCLKYMNSPMQADDSFRKVLAHEKDLQSDRYLIPFAIFEIGILLWSQGNREEAIATLENAKNNYKGYAMESRLHFRLHSALAELKHVRRNDAGNDFGLEDMSENALHSLES